jgi:hypothetical protein
MWAAEEENQLLGSRPRIALHAVTAVTRKPKKTLPFLCRFRQLASRRSDLVGSAVLRAPVAAISPTGSAPVTTGHFTKTVGFDGGGADRIADHEVTG